MIPDEIKNLDDIKIKIMMQEGKIRFERIKDKLDEFEMNALERKVNDGIEVLKNEEKNRKNITDCLKKSKPELLDLYTTKNRDIIDYFKNQNMNIKNINQ